MRVPYLSVEFPLFDPMANVQAVSGISTDLARHKRAELELEQQRDELAHLARVMTLLCVDPLALYAYGLGSSS